MRVKEFRGKIKLDSKLIIEGREFEILEIVKFRFDDGDFYMKLFLSDGYVLADDIQNNFFVFVREIKNDIAAPFPEKLSYDGKEFKFLYKAHAMAEEVLGQEIFKKGDSETFWDYQSSDKSYLSLGIDDQTGERQDFYGKVIAEVNVG